MNLSRWQKADTWTFADAAHLLRRAGFGAPAAEVSRVHRLGLDQAVEELCKVQPEADDFQYASSALKDAALASGNIDHLKSWWLHRMRYSNNPFVEKLTLLWHNHFATSNAKVRSVPMMLQQNELFRSKVFADFRTLLHAASRDVAMLVWLDGNANRKRAANENFAREIMELFSLGVGNYTENDIQEAARAFTGWHLRNDEFWFDRSQHDPSPKTVFGKTGKFTGTEIVDLCLDHPACSRFIASKILRCLVCDRPSAEAITAVANRLRETRFSFAVVLRELLKSELFFDPQNQGAIIRGPVDFAVGYHRILSGRPNFDQIIPMLRIQGQDVFEPPTVKGWDGGRLWIGAATMLARTQFCADVLDGTKFGEIAKPQAALGITENDPQPVTKQLAAVLAAKPFSVETQTQIIHFLKSSRSSDETRLRGAIHLALTSPECQLM